MQAVVLDIGGVLEFTPDTGWRARWERRLRLPPGGLDERLTPVWQAGAVGRISLDAVMQDITVRLGITAQDANAMMEEAWQEYLGTPNTPLLEFVRQLRPSVRTGIISNSFVGAREREQAAYGMADLCDVLVYSHEVAVEKPDPEIFHLAQRQLGVPYPDMAFVDDVPRNVDAARALGMHAILFEDTAQTLQALRRWLGQT